MKIETEFDIGYEFWVARVSYRYIQDTIITNGKTYISEERVLVAYTKPKTLTMIEITVTEGRNLSERLGVRLLLKREDLTHTGSHKINNVLGQALLTKRMGKDRIIANPNEVITRNPDIIMGSWCGRKFNPDHVRSRPGWHAIAAVKNNHLYEIKSPVILQPGPAALTDGIKAMQTCMALWNNSN